MSKVQSIRGVVVRSGHDDQLTSVVYECYDVCVLICCLAVLYGSDGVIVAQLTLNHLVRCKPAMTQ